MSRARSIAASFRARLLIGYVVVAAVFAAAWLWSLYGPLTQAVIDNQQRSLAAVARSGAALLEETSETPTFVATRLVRGTDLRVTVVAADGRVLADSAVDPASMGNHADRPEIAAALEGTESADRRRSATRGDEELYVAVPATVDNARVALRVAQPIAVAESVAASSQRIGILLLIIAVLIAGAVALWAARAAARPVDELSAAARRMADGDLATRIPEVPADLQTLARSLSDLRVQIRTRIEELQREREALSTALDGLADAVFLVHSDTIEFANSSASRLFRAPGGDWRDKPLAGAGLPGSLAGELTRLHAAGGGSREIGPDPTGRWLRVSVVPLSADGDSWLAVVADVSERASVDQVRRDFVANASHELKTPVAGIQLLAENAGAAAEDGDTETALMFTRQIAEQAERLRRLVGELLDLSRLELAPEPGSVTDLRHAIGNAIAGHRAAAARKGLELGEDLSAVIGADVFASADPTDVAVALDNLLDNAIAYTETGSVTVTLSAEDSVARLRVSDTGIGIPAEALPRIFERFFRVDRARSRDSGGTGLGLALVKHVAERSGGTVSVESTPGTGTTFTLELPRATARG